MSGGDWKDLYHAAENGDFALARYHLQEGVDPNYQHPEVMCSPLVASLIHGHDEVAQLLLAHGADPNLPSDFDDLTPLEAAQRHERQAMLERLTALGARPRSNSKPFWWRWLPI
jgi:ankyrin repeat protein